MSASKKFNIAAVYPYDPTSPSRVRSMDTLGVLLDIGNVTVFAPDLNDSAKERLEELGCRCVTKKDNFFIKLLRIFFAILRFRSISFSYYRSVLPDSLGEFNFFFFERVTPPKGSIPVIYDIVDNFESQVKQLATTAKGIKRIGYFYDSLVIRRDILTACKRASLVLCTTAKEVDSLVGLGVKREKLEDYLHQSQVVIPDLEVTDESALAFEMPLAVFHGRASYSANQLAANFIENVLVKAGSKWSFLIFGEGWPQRKADNLEFLGFQEDLRILRAADLAVFPIQSAVGVQNKVLEALAAGLPVIVTPALVEGLPVEIVDSMADRIIVANMEDFGTILSGPPLDVSRSRSAEVRFRNAYAGVMNKNRIAIGDRLIGAIIED